MTTRHQPVACSLSETDAAHRALEWAEAQRRILRTETLDNGVAMVFNASRADGIADLALRESACCGFLSITTSTVGNEFRLEITTDDPDAAPVIAYLTGTGPP